MKIFFLKRAQASLSRKAVLEKAFQLSQQAAALVRTLEGEAPELPRSNKRKASDADSPAGQNRIKSFFGALRKKKKANNASNNVAGPSTTAAAAAASSATADDSLFALPTPFEASVLMTEDRTFHRKF